MQYPPCIKQYKVICSVSCALSWHFWADQREVSCAYCLLLLPLLCLPFIPDTQMVGIYLHAFSRICLRTYLGIYLRICLGIYLRIYLGIYSIIFTAHHPLLPEKRTNSEPAKNIWIYSIQRNLPIICWIKLIDWHKLVVCWYLYRKKLIWEYQ